MKFAHHLWLVAIILFAWRSPDALAAIDTPQQAPLAQMADEMNGYRIDQFGDFTKKWHFVTVRFRRDTGEQRFVYANDIAWKALLEHSKDYPDGAVFAKIAVATSEDSSFVDSSVPSGSKRVQFMVKDRKKHKATDGWGYAVFNSQGLVAIAEPQDKASEACNACHQVMRNKGLVFAEPMGEIFPSQAQAVQPVALNQPPADIPFITVDRAILPAFVQKEIPPSLKQVRMLGGPMPEHVFHGTIYEAMPLIQAEAARSNMAALLVGKNGTPEFSLAWPTGLTDPATKPCTLPGRAKGVLVTGGHTVTYPQSPPGERYRYQPDAPYCSPTGLPSNPANISQ
ncbi:MAG: cytochrome P460 family protein [Rhodomicrobium sp.]